MGEKPEGKPDKNGRETAPALENRAAEPSGNEVRRKIVPCAG